MWIVKAIQHQSCMKTYYYNSSMILCVLLSSGMAFFYKVLFFELHLQIVSHDVVEGSGGVMFTCWQLFAAPPP